MTRDLQAIDTLLYLFPIISCYVIYYTFLCITQEYDQSAKCDFHQLEADVGDSGEAPYDFFNSAKNSTSFHLKLLRRLQLFSL
jgi:hypothetical protein